MSAKNGTLMQRVYRSDHYKMVKESVDNATELNEMNVSKRYYSNKVAESQNKTFSHYLLEQLIKNLGEDYFYRTEIVETFNPVKSSLDKQLQMDQNPLDGFIINNFKHLFLINADFIKGLYPARYERFNETDKLLDYLRTYPTIQYLFDYDHITAAEAIDVLKNMK
ncbi:hypothetical protein CO725_00770 [Vibrio parahaemolyticus]|uniref:hypothetical protein n=1 Tax=Vibrio parahaemolyticus TaxID=670 RepID=UPI000BE4734E|nr:hypothetical protein [Vibrio parahaemolyticus]ATI44218.1 hypothetical protein CO725_00770 [Vibrio parahaemolyticus]